ncbi:MAG: hypothetical protein QOH49_2768 [Acidobacteriota bacterium]|jgi:hypothetical protein|nr:hypothetical protein [Acidobacteriota bacterium]
MLLKSRPKSHKLLLAVAALLLSLAAAAPLCAQSSEASFPTPVLASELSGRIAPRDMGDARRTRHFYIFRGTEGDLIVNLETIELIGDVDVFTATGFRPLVKFTLFGDPARLSKSFYLRKEETLVLRVEARAVGDVEGTYRVSFGGSFLPAPPELANQTTPEAPTLASNEPRGKNTRRVTATGARIEEPRVEPAPTKETAIVEPTPAPTSTPERATGRRSTTPRRGRGTRPAPSRSRTSESAATPAPAQPESTEAKPAEETTAGTATPVEKPTPAPSTPARRRGTRTPRRGSTRESAESRRAETPAQPSADTQPEPAAAPPTPAPAQRLIIVTKDGETLERDMSGVRRVTIENNQVVIIGRDGKVTRRPLASILKMSIEP